MKFDIVLLEWGGGRKKVDKGIEKNLNFPVPSSIERATAENNIYYEIMINLKYLFLWQCKKIIKFSEIFVRCSAVNNFFSVVPLMPQQKSS